MKYLEVLIMITNCKKCSLFITRTQMVWGKGVSNKIMIIGEAPGYTEDKQGKPFVGKAGKHLDLYLKRFKLQNHVYITNVLKCRPEGNRTPFPEEIELCREYLNYEIESINPVMFLLLGNTALQTVTGLSGIKTYHGKLICKNIIPTFHPSYGMRNIDYLEDNIGYNKEIYDDFRKVIYLYKQLNFWYDNDT